MNDRKSPPRLTVIIPTLNPGPRWKDLSVAVLANLRHLRLSPSTVLVLDSGSKDGTVAEARAAGFRVRNLDRRHFDHGGTRQLAIDQETGSEFLLFLTHDAVLASAESMAILLGAFRDPSIGAAFGRQLPRTTAGAIEAHARAFNYPELSRVRSLEDRQLLGFKSVFASNAFCAFRRSALTEIGGFPLRIICSEETVAMACLHMAGWRSAYVAEALVYHSHSFSVAEEFRRYFDIGVTHARHPFLTENFGTASGEGKRFVLSEVRYLLRKAPLQVPIAWLRTLTKMLGYRLGRREASLSPTLRRYFSANRSFWLADEPAIKPGKPEILRASEIARDSPQVSQQR